MTSHFVYISRRREDIVERVTKGEILSLSLDGQGSPERPRKFPSYVVTRSPVGVDPSLAKELPGVHSANRFRQDGVPINRTKFVVTWSLPDPPPPNIAFRFLPCLPECELGMTIHGAIDVGEWVTSHAIALRQRSVLGLRVADSRTCPHRGPPNPLPPLPQPQSRPSRPHLTPTIRDALGVTSKELMSVTGAPGALSGPQPRRLHHHEPHSSNCRTPLLLLTPPQFRILHISSHFARLSPP